MKDSELKSLKYRVERAEHFLKRIEELEEFKGEINQLGNSELNAKGDARLTVVYGTTQVQLYNTKPELAIRIRESIIKQIDERIHEFKLLYKEC